MLKKKLLNSFIIFSLLSGILSFLQPNEVHAFSNQVLQKGAVGNDVIELQSRLKNIGFFHGKIDGVFGWSTYWALRNFQYEFGLPIDGYAGSKTKAKLVKVTKYNGVSAAKNQGNPTPPNSAAKPKTVNTPEGVTENDIRLMSNAVYGESRGEPFIGQVAVAAVILNRLSNPAFPKTIPGIIFQPGAFTAVADGQIWLTPNEQSKKAVIDALNGWDPTDNAMYYFNPATATSPWIWGRPQIKKIGKHIFCK
ncbi:spore cortex-lytic enzyme [Bacillus sp. BRMEA1]|nr:spore cortex-lytic enzyme [Neobacillus endophyticus]NRD80594.1 spore cortex-lytic enzyme [Neobacillus endophyticus]